MKIVVSSKGRDIESNIDTIFGRALFFLILDIKTNEKKVIENKVRDRSTGVGITIGNIVLNEEIDAVITTNIGPHAFETFEQSGIKIYQAGGKIKDAIRLFKEERLSEITKATVPKYSGLKKKK